jgi:3'(2'), 5'-bisphosphate nucleotidase
MREILDAMVGAVRQAEAAILAIYERGGPVQTKPDQTPLTAADLASHAVLVERLAAIRPRLPVVSEEDGELEPTGRQGWAAHWLVDPLDGSKEFLARNGEFTINVALVEHGRPALGVVSAPALGLVFTGDVARSEALRIDSRGVAPIRSRFYSGASPTVLASRRHGGPALGTALERLQRHFGTVSLSSVGSSLKFCLLAEGRADVYPRLAATSEWDTAAAQAVLEAAGGAVLQLDGTPLRYGKPDILNPEFVAVADPAVDWVSWFRA